MRQVYPQQSKVTFKIAERSQQRWYEADINPRRQREEGQQHKKIRQEAHKH